MLAVDGALIEIDHAMCASFASNKSDVFVNRGHYFARKKSPAFPPGFGVAVILARVEARLALRLLLCQASATQARSGKAEQGQPAEDQRARFGDDGEFAVVVQHGPDITTTGWCGINPIATQGDGCQ